MKIAFVYAGQGSQYVGMGKDIYDTSPLFQETIDRIDSIIPVKELSFNGPEEMLQQTKNTQPAMVAFAIAMTELLKSQNIQPAMVAGLSLGEYSALYAADVLSAEDVMDLIAFRGMVMTESAKGVETSMMAVLGLTLDEVQAVLDTVEEGVVEISNSNTAGQIVIGGSRQSVEIACERLKEAGAKRCMPLKVSGPFHTSFMDDAEAKLREKFTELTFHTAKLPVIHNRTGMLQQSNEKLEDLLAEQVNHTVLFEKSIQTMLNEGINTFIEIGPGKVLSGFIKRMNRDVQLYAVDSAESVEQIVQALNGEK